MGEGYTRYSSAARPRTYVLAPVVDITGSKSAKVATAGRFSAANNSALLKLLDAEMARIVSAILARGEAVEFLGIPKSPAQSPELAEFEKEIGWARYWTVVSHAEKKFTVSRAEVRDGYSGYTRLFIPAVAAERV
jgi:hypothetical protein